MSSFVRNMQRKRLRQVRFTTDADGNQVRVEHEPKPQFTEARGDGYLTVRYTRGPRLISGARLRAQGRMAEIMHAGEFRQQQRAMQRMFEKADERSSNEQRIRALLTTPVLAITRQMRRHSVRTGTPLPPVIGAVAEAPKRARKPRTEEQKAARRAKSAGATA